MITKTREITILATSYTPLAAPAAERMTKITEEMSESIKEIQKTQLHGFDSFNPKKPKSLTNREKIEDEIGNVLAATEMSIAAGDLDVRKIKESARKKLETYKYGGVLRHQPLELLETLGPFRLIAN